MEQMELAREIYANSLPFSKIAPIMEAEQLSEYAATSEYEFVATAARIYGCTAVNGDNDNLMKFLTSIYHYGRVQGIRVERTKKKGGAIS